MYKLENNFTNSLILSGLVSGGTEFSHESHETRFYTFKLKTRRLSGTYDTINMLIRENLMDCARIYDGSFITAQCELRSFNRRESEKNRLIISAFVKEIAPCEEGLFENYLTLSGTICKTPTYRKTPLGREICDIMLASNRRYGRSDYIPLIAWGQNAKTASIFDTGDMICVNGRLQSREYTKDENGEEVTKTAFEVSVSSIREISEHERTSG